MREHAASITANAACKTKKSYLYNCFKALQSVQFQTSDDSLLDSANIAKQLMDVRGINSNSH